MMEQYQGLDPCLPALRLGLLGVTPVKGEAVRAFTGQQIAALSDVKIDCRAVNALNLDILVSGSGVSGTVSVEGAPEAGADYLPLDDPNSSHAGVTANDSLDCVVGTAWARVRLAAVAGTFKPGQGFTITATPFISPGQGRVTITMG